MNKEIEEAWENYERTGKKYVDSIEKQRALGKCISISKKHYEDVIEANNQLLTDAKEAKNASEELQNKLREQPFMSPPEKELLKCLEDGFETFDSIIDHALDTINVYKKEFRKAQMDYRYADDKQAFSEKYKVNPDIMELEISGGGYKSVLYKRGIEIAKNSISFLFSQILI